MAQDEKQHSIESHASYSNSTSGSSLKSLTPKSISKSSDAFNSKGYKPGEWLSRSFAQTMLWSDFGLSLFECPLNRQQADVVCTQLTDLNCKITAIWVVARPLSYDRNGRFQHWAIKLQAPPSLISLDFLEVKKKGFIRFESTVASPAELKDFLWFYYNDKKHGRKRKKWKILASVTPSPLQDPNYLKTLDEFDTSQLKTFMNSYKKKKKKKSINNNNNNHENETNDIDIKFDPMLKDIACKKKVCDIADFISMWTQSNHDNGNLGASRKLKHDVKGYNAIINNCQQFVADLFHFLCSAEHPNKVQQIYELRDIPFTSLNNKKKKKKNLIQRVHSHDKKENSVTYTNSSHNDNEQDDEKYNNDDQDF